jgi:hypothetical protein
MMVIPMAPKRIALIIIVWLAWVGSASAATPTLVQHVSSSTNPVGNGIAGKNFKIPLPNPTAAGNTLILGITYTNGLNPSSLTDSVNGTWPAATVTADGGSLNYIAAIYVFHNSGAGQITITVNFASDFQPFQYVVSEYAGLATVNTNDKSVGATNLSGSSLAIGNFTPANNNSNGGNLIWAHYAPNRAVGGNPTNWVAGTNFSLLSADIAWINNAGFPHATQASVQTTAAALNPTITPTGDSTDTFNGVAVSIEAAATGSDLAPGIRVRRISRQSMTSFTTPVDWKLKFPTQGNLLVFACSAPTSALNITSISDNINGAWTARSTSGWPQIWDRVNATPGATLVVTVHITGTPSGQTTVGLWDVSGADPNAFDSCQGTQAAGPTNASSVSVSNEITPSTLNGLVIGILQLGTGPGLAVTSPVGAIWTMCTYTDENDNDLMENADGKAHCYNPTAAPETWTWTITPSLNTDWSTTIVAYKSAAVLSAAVPPLGDVALQQRAG